MRHNPNSSFARGVQERSRADIPAPPASLANAQVQEGRRSPVAEEEEEEEAPGSG